MIKISHSDLVWCQNNSRWAGVKVSHSDLVRLARWAMRRATVHSPVMRQLAVGADAVDVHTARAHHRVADGHLALHPARRPEGDEQVAVQVSRRGQSLLRLPDSATMKQKNVKNVEKKTLDTPNQSNQSQSKLFGVREFRAKKKPNTPLPLVNWDAKYGSPARTTPKRIVS